MKLLKQISVFIYLVLSISQAFAYLKYYPVTFTLSNDKESYYEGEKITFLITIKNNDKEQSVPVLVPHTQNTGQKLFYLSAYDKANNTHLLRFTEDKMLNMLVHDTGTVKIIRLKPQEQITIPIYMNDFDNYFSYQTQNSSHHSFGVPLFAGIYKMQLTYNPMGIALGDSIYNCYDDTEKELPANGKWPMPASGFVSSSCLLKIKRSADTIVTIERRKYFIKTNGNAYYYLSANLPQITTDTTCHHITNLPPDSCSIVEEYFYSHFTDLYAEYMSRFKDGDIREYRRYSDYCPEYLYTERYNDFKQKTAYELQLTDKRFYSVSYHQPGGNIHQETYCSADGTLCLVATYVYDKEGKFKRKEFSQTQPCVEVMIEGKKRSLKYAENLQGN